MSRPPATSRKVGRAVVLLALFWVSLRATQTAWALLGAGAVPFPRPQKRIRMRWKRRRPRELQTHFDELEGLLMQAASAQTADPVEDAKQAVPPRVLLLAFLVAG
ncbi:unnamed protein product [Symbiodinium natans]|uniref:Uncharacterized protein n=1 Tax=Symbiodinium natans TaxID=878477 RepID=A0A812KPW1_9DINO|nr:unnamed protein product [Symbiodinium natans]